MPSWLRYPTDRRWLLLAPAPESTRLCSWPQPVRLTSPNQSVFWLRSRVSNCDACACTAAANCGPFSIAENRVTWAADMLALYSTRGPPCPDFVVMSTTPLDAFAP